MHGRDKPAPARTNRDLSALPGGRRCVEWEPPGQQRTYRQQSRAMLGTPATLKVPPLCGLETQEREVADQREGRVAEGGGPSTPLTRPEETPLAARGRRPASGRLRSTKKCATCEERGSVKFDGLPAVALEAEQRAAQGST